MLLFAADVVIPRLVPGFPASGAWLGQLLAAALLALAALDWLGRSQLLGGIYGRPIVFANSTFYFVGAMVAIREASRSGGAAPWAAAVALTTFAVVYGWLLLRGPIERDFQASRRATGADS